MSSYEFEPFYQTSFGIPDNGKGLRGVPDVSYNSDPGKGYSVCDSV